MTVPSEWPACRGKVAQAGASCKRVVGSRRQGAWVKQDELRSLGRPEAREPRTVPSATGPVPREAARCRGASTCVMWVDLPHFSRHRFPTKKNELALDAPGVPGSMPERPHPECSAEGPHTASAPQASAVITAAVISTSIAPFDSEHSVSLLSDRTTK